MSEPTNKMTPIEERASAIIAEAKELAKHEAERVRQYAREWARALPEIAALELRGESERAERLIAHIKAQRENLESVEATRVGKLVDDAAVKLLRGVGVTLAAALSA